MGGKTERGTKRSQVTVGKLILSFGLFIITLTDALTVLPMTCSYGARGSLTSTCTNATPSYFRATSYRFDNLDETVQCLDCNLDTLEANTFDISGNQIKTLNISNSKIRIVKPKAFMGLVFLLHLELQKNNINSIPAGSFEGIKKVESLNIENNAISMLVPNGFKELESLETLNLKGNQIKSIDASAFAGLVQLTTLDLSNNRLGDVRDSLLGMPLLKSLNLENNEINQINPVDFKEVGNIVDLSIANNNLNQLDTDAFLYLNHLEALDLSGNRLQELKPYSFRGLDAIEILNLADNSITDINKGSLQGLHQLRYLNLANNKLPICKTGWFSGLPELRTLNLTHNVITEVQRSGIFPLASMHTLDISNNNIEDLDYKFLIDHMPKIAYLEMENNPWPACLKAEMEEFFKFDNVKFNLGDNLSEDSSVKCDVKNVSAPGTVYYAMPEKIIQETSSDGSFLLYALLFMTIAAVAVIGYFQFKSQREIKEIICRGNFSENQLLSSHDLESRHNDY